MMSLWQITLYIYDKVEHTESTDQHLQQGHMIPGFSAGEGEEPPLLYRLVRQWDLQSHVDVTSWVHFQTSSHFRSAVAHLRQEAPGFGLEYTL